ncbi:hypothetical protein N9L68_04275 [bacterium]|nr:hypothetical protein [bacterium]
MAGGTAVAGIVSIRVHEATVVWLLGAALSIKTRGLDPRRDQTSSWAGHWRREGVGCHASIVVEHGGVSTLAQALEEGPIDQG